MAANSPSAPVLRTDGYGKTERQDAWWSEQVFTIVALGLFTVYAVWAALQNGHFEAGPYLSPFYSPKLKEMFPAMFAWVSFSPAFLVMWAPLGFRGTCYFYRRAVYRSVFNDPPSCAVDKPKARPQNYTGEKLFPFVLMNFHRYFLYLALILTVFHWVHVGESLFYEGEFGFGLGSAILFLDAILLTAYVFSCHSLRHLLGGKLDRFTGGAFSKLRHAIWKEQSGLNENHMIYAWSSLFTVGLADLYIRLVSMGLIQDLNTWGVDFTHIAGH